VRNSDKKNNNETDLNSHSLKTLQRKERLHPFDGIAGHFIPIR
jgi:hypothetical protein